MCLAISIVHDGQKRVEVTVSSFLFRVLRYPFLYPEWGQGKVRCIFKPPEIQSPELYIFSGKALN